MSHSHLRRSTLIRSALESPDLHEFNGGSNVEIRPLGTEITQNFLEKIFFITLQFCGNLAFSKLRIPAPSGWISKFDPSFASPLYNTLASVRQLFSEIVLFMRSKRLNTCRGRKMKRGGRVRCTFRRRARPRQSRRYGA